MAADWTDMVAAERIALDREFTDRVEASSFTRQEWGLVMTALEFEIETPEDPDSARLRPDTAKVASVLPALEDVRTAGPARAGASQAPRAGVIRRGRDATRRDGDGESPVEGAVVALREGLGVALRRTARWTSATIDGVSRALGLPTDDDRERMAEIDSLATQYCELLQERLETNGRWEAVCRRARQ